MVRIRGRMWSGEGSPRGGGQERKLGRGSVCYEWSCEGGTEGRVCRCLDRRSGGVGCCCWLGDVTSYETKQGTGRCRFLDVILTSLACGVGGSTVGLWLLSGFRVPIECVAVDVSVGPETRLVGRLGLVHGGVSCVLGSDGNEDGEGYEGWLNGGHGSSVCRTRRVRAQPARSRASTDVSDASLGSARCGRRG